jgi:hypothetical protein
MSSSFRERQLPLTSGPIATALLLVHDGQPPHVVVENLHRRRLGDMVAGARHLALYLIVQTGVELAVDVATEYEAAMQRFPVR